MTNAVRTLEKRLGYSFKDPALAAEALAHRSARCTSNERLEFLGDAVVNLVIAEALFELRPDLEEGDLTRMRASLVMRDALAVMARKLQIGSLLTLGPGEQRSGAFQRHSILGDALEAVLGAVFLDGGYGSACTVIRRLYAGRLENLPDPGSLKDAKTYLQELLQARGLALPTYAIVETSGPEHARRFAAECQVPELGLVGTGTGTTRRSAEQAAAAALLEIMPA
jgi:ribonuclease III